MVQVYQSTKQLKSQTARRLSSRVQPGGKARILNETATLPFTRLTNALSKKFENLCHAVALHYMYYNFCRVHQTLRVTPAMEAGIADHVWSLEELVALLDFETAEAAVA